MKYAIFENNVYVGFSTIPFETDNENISIKEMEDEKIDVLEMERQLSFNETINQ